MPPTTATGDLTVATRFITFSTTGEGHIVNITQDLKDLLAETGLDAGTATVFAPGATAAVTTLSTSRVWCRTSSACLTRSSPVNRTTSTTYAWATATAIPLPSRSPGSLAGHPLLQRTFCVGHLAGRLFRVL